MSSAFFFDYVDPESFLVERALARLEAEAGVRVERVPLELRPPPMSLLDPAAEPWRSRWEAGRAAAAREGLTLVRPRFLPWTRKAHELARQAETLGRFDAVHGALFEAFHLQGRDLGRIDVLLEIATRHGMDLTETKAALDVDHHEDAVVAARARAERSGILGVPSVLAGPSRLIGLHDGDALRALLRDA